MQYEITTGKTPEEAKLVINIDRIPFLAIPGVVMVGIGDKSKVYRRYLDKNLFSGNTQLLNSLVKMHDMAIDNGGMHLQCNCRGSKFHAQVLKDLIIENADTFTNLISYLIPDSKNKTVVMSTAETDSELDTMSVMPPMGQQMTLADLNVPGADQLRSLITADLAKAKESSEAPQAETPPEVNVPNVVHIQ